MASCTFVERLHAKGAILHIGNPGRVDPKEPTGALLLYVLGAIAQFERQMIMLERQREGIAKAKRGGKYPGRAPTARAKAADVRSRLGSAIASWPRGGARRHR